MRLIGNTRMLPFLTETADTTASSGGVGNVVAFLSALAALVSVAITSLRKRKDVSVTEMETRITALEAEVAELRDDLAVAQALALTRGRDLFIVRNVLAESGIFDPTERDEPR